MRTTLVLMLMVSLTGCVEIRRFLCSPDCVAESHNTSSLVGFLYPDGKAPPQADTTPELRVPLRIGLAFLPSQTAAAAGLDAARRDQLMTRIRQQFIERRFVHEIVLIPDYYLEQSAGFKGLEGVQRLYNVDLLALVSYDQVTYMQDNDWSLSYLTIVGAYIVKGSRHDISTLVDLAVVDPATRSLVLRAGGTDTRHSNTTLIEQQRAARDASGDAFASATDQMIRNFDGALQRFEADVRAGKANVRVVNRNQEPRGGGGAFGWVECAGLLLACALARRRWRRIPVSE
ncbi:MAG TPA: rhombotarget lipoprotein [Steroidobacteraceae bacterium]|nr:rhombotarget lipoprotein [Steroidobacteraceae bacterium]